jgi:hypothetical protein
VIDAAGNLWNAQWGASRVACYSPDGAFLKAVSFPARHTSCPAFGGEGFSTLFCTTAREHLSPEVVAAEPRERPDLRRGERGPRASRIQGPACETRNRRLLLPRTLGRRVWAEDAARMAEAGIAWVRIGEFAWSRMEPEPGRLVWDWLDRAIDTLGAAGLKVVLGTPTATPPRWMLARHPDMLAVDAEGRPRGFGSRRHYDFSHDGYREECRRIAKAMGERYGRHPHVHAWQIDNEYDCHATTLSYSDAARRAFRDWLAQRYQSPEALNRAWGNVFWSMEYRDWDEIDLPNLTVTEPNPAHVMAFRRFASDQVVRFNRAQAEVLRKLTDRPLIHNYMGRTLAFDHLGRGRRSRRGELGQLPDRLPVGPDRGRRRNTRRATCGRATPTCRPSTTTSTGAWGGAAGG